MALRLVLMRHGNADPGYGLDDHERPLTLLGRGEALRVGRALVEEGWAPDVVRGSDAVRTRQTWAAMQGAVPSPAAVSWTRDLYLPTLERLARDAAGWDRAATTILCLGHNPGWSDAATRLTGRRIGLGTAFAALLSADAADWAEAFTTRWELEGLLRP